MKVGFHFIVNLSVAVYELLFKCEYLGVINDLNIENEQYQILIIHAGSLGPLNMTIALHNFCHFLPVNLIINEAQ